MAACAYTLTNRGDSLVKDFEVNDQHSFKSITAARRDRSYAPIDFDSLAVTDFHVPALYKNRQLSQEFQLLYEGDRLNGVAGVYYLEADALTFFDAPFPAVVLAAARGAS